MAYTKSEMMQYVAENDVKFVKLFFTDIFGITRSVSVSPDELGRAFDKGFRVDISSDEDTAGAFLANIGDTLRLIPDAATLAVLPWRPQHGRVVRYFCQVRDGDGGPSECDTREALSRVSSRAATNGWKVTIRAVCEFSLFLLDDDGNPTDTPHDEAAWCDLAPLDRGENVRRDICLTLEQMGISHEASWHTAGGGKHAVSLRPTTPLRTADNICTFRMVVKTVAARNGLCAKFVASPLTLRFWGVDDARGEVISEVSRALKDSLTPMSAFLWPNNLNGVKDLGNAQLQAGMTANPYIALALVLAAAQNDGKSNASLAASVLTERTASSYLTGRGIALRKL